MAKRKRRRAAKKSAKCCCSKGACAFWGFVVLIVGVLFLLEDLNYLSLYGVSWWSAVLMLIGLMKVTRSLH